MPIIKVEGLRCVFGASTPFETVALKNIDLEIEQGQMLAIIGHTGSGKSSFIQHLNGLLQPSEGRIYVDGQDIHADKRARRDVKRKVGLVFQYPEYQLFEETVYKDIAFGPQNMGLDTEEIDRRVREAAAFTGIEEELFAHSPLELSGGQKRRVAIAGVLAMRPQVLILDEPTAGLDPVGCRQILSNMCNYREKSGTTVIFVSHSMDDVAQIAQRILVFDHGSIVMDGSPEKVFSQPEKLIAMGLNVPHATQIAMALVEQGLMLGEACYTHEQLKAAILRKKEAGVC